MRQSKSAAGKAGGRPESLDAVEMALDGDPGARDEAARALIVEQTRLVRAQLHHLTLQKASERVGLGLKVLTGLAGLAAAGVLGLMAWNASHDRSLVITAFSAPPELAARGVSGQVFAAKLMDHLAAIDAQATSFRAAKTFTGDWGGDIRVEIPETGVSISELDRYLRSLLGHRTSVGGEMVLRKDGALLVTVRDGPGQTTTVTGTEDGLDDLAQAAAEAVFRQTQPFRYSKYLEAAGRMDEAMAVARRLAEHGAPEERAWAWAQISNLLEVSDEPASVEAARKAVAIDPGNGLGWLNLAIAANFLGHPEQAYQANSHAVGLLSRAGGGLSADGIAIGRFVQPRVLAAVGDFCGAARAQRALGALPSTYLGIDTYVPTNLAGFLIRCHEVTTGRATPGLIEDRVLAETLTGAAGELRSQYQAAAELEDWPAAERYARVAIAAALGGGTYVQRLTVATRYQPYLALAVAWQGRIAEAQGLIAPSPLDCYACLVIRGQIAAMAHDDAGAEHWFVEAARQGPSLPFAHTSWAASLLSRGDPAAAVRMADIAIARSPRYADARELKGEALLAQGDTTGAGRAFAAADALTPRWGRNHMMWGVALARAGKATQARAQWLTARGLDLSVGDRARLDALLKGARA